MKEKTEKLKQLCSEAERLLAQDPQGEQVIVLLTDQGHLHHLINHGIVGGCTDDEDRFIAMLRETEDTQVQCLVCMWQQCCLDVPSMHFRQGLLELSAGNGEALMLLQGEGHLNARTVRSTMP